MKKTVIPASYFVFSLLVFIGFVGAETTVTVEPGKVTVDQNQPSVAVVQESPVVVTKTEDPRQLEGEIIRVDIPESQIVVRDQDGRERKVLIKQGMINDYKVDDYVKIYLMADLKEAKTIHTVQTADVDGDIVSIDRTKNVIVVRESNKPDRIIVVTPTVINSYKAGDRVRLYVVSDYPMTGEAKLIRVR